MSTFSERLAQLISQLKTLHLRRAYDRQGEPEFRRQSTLRQLARHYQRYDELLNRGDDSRSGDDLRALEDRLRIIEAEPDRDPAEMIVLIEALIATPVVAERATASRSFFGEEEAAAEDEEEASQASAEEAAAVPELIDLSPNARAMVDLLGTQAMQLSNRGEKLRREGATFTPEEYDSHAGPLSLASGLYNARIRAGELDVTTGELDEYKFKRQIALTGGTQQFLPSIDRLHDFVQARLVSTDSPA